MTQSPSGIPVTVQPREEMLAELAETKDPVIYSVIRVRDHPAATLPAVLRARNKQTRCDQCGEICWYDPVHSIAGVRILCTTCFPVGKHPNVRMTREQLTEILRMDAQ